MHAKTIEKINGYASLLRFITPILVSVVLYFLIQVHCDLKLLQEHFTNHLADHTKLESRITRVETLLDMLVKDRKLEVK